MNLSLYLCSFKCFFCFGNHFSHSHLPSYWLLISSYTPLKTKLILFNPSFLFYFSFFRKTRNTPHLLRTSATSPFSPSTLISSSSLPLFSFCSKSHLRSTHPISGELIYLPSSSFSKSHLAITHLRSTPIYPHLRRTLRHWLVIKERGKMAKREVE